MYILKNKLFLMYMIDQDITIETTENGHKLIQRGRKYFLQTHCEMCKKFIERQTTIKKFGANKHKTFCCSRDCLNESQRSGAIKQKKEKYFLEKYGVVNAGAIPAVKNKVKQTCIERYGVSNISKIPEISESKSQKMKDICENTDFRKRVENTNLERYGCKSFLATEQSREALRDFSLRTYGVEHHTQSEEFQEQYRQLCLERHGVENTSQLESTQEKIRQTNLERYGVDNIFKRPDVIENRMIAIRNNAHNLTSKAEEQIFEILKEHFEEIKTQVYVKHSGGRHSFWLIDFHLVKEDIYIQFDGIYWHGIGKDVEKLKLEDSRSSKMQLGSIERDLKQDAWFKENNKTLFRIIEGTPTETWLSDLNAIINSNGNVLKHDSPDTIRSV